MTSPEMIASWATMPAPSQITTSSHWPGSWRDSTSQAP